MIKIEVNLEPVDLTCILLKAIFNNMTNNANKVSLVGGEVLHSSMPNKSVSYKVVVLNEDVYLVECNDDGELFNDFDLAREDDRNYIKSNYIPLSEHFVDGDLNDYLVKLNLVLNK